MGEADQILFQYHWKGGDLEGASVQGAFFQKNEKTEIYDLASLTKVICTGSLLAQVYLQGNLTWNDFYNQKMIEFIPELQGGPLEKVLLSEVWEHRSGLRAHDLVWGGRVGDPVGLHEDRAKKWQDFVVFLKSEKISGAKECVYSDLGFLLLGIFLERRLGKNLQQAFREWKTWAGLRSPTLDFLPQSFISKVVPTETRHAVGEVNDDNAYCLGGIAPHAGLFGSVDDVWHYLQALRRLSRDCPRMIPYLDVSFSPTVANRFYCGWDRPSRVYDAASKNSKEEFHSGESQLPNTIGHLGYTGTALWWDPLSGLAGVLLSNRVFPSHSSVNQSQIKSLRHRFFTALWKGKLGKEWQ